MTKTTQEIIRELVSRKMEIHSPSCPTIEDTYASCCCGVNSHNDCIKESIQAINEEATKHFSEGVQYMLGDISDETVVEYIDNALRAQISRDMLHGNLKSRIDLPYVEDWDDVEELKKRRENIR